MQDIDKGHNFIPDIETAYDISSRGMGLHVQAVSMLRSGDILPDWARESLTTVNSNYIAQPYVIGWVRPESGLGTPSHVSPYSEQHKALYDHTRDEYEGLEWEMLRNTLAGTVGMKEMVPYAIDSKSPMTYEEFQAYMNVARDQGLVMFEDTTEISIPSTADQLFWEMVKNGYKVTDKFFESENEKLLTESNRSQIVQAATHKLGVMLGITEQILFDAHASQTPIPAEYKPQSDLLDTTWRELFAVEVPTISQMYREAHELLVNTADPNDPAIEHLRSLDTTLYFAP